MTSMFWGLRLEPGKRYTTTVDKSFHVSMAALDVPSVKSDKDVQSVMLEEGESNIPFILCNLQKPKVLQSRLDLNFVTGDRVTFFCRGNANVHLTGYLMPDDDNDFSALGEELEEEEEEEEEDDEEEENEEKDKENVKNKSKVNGLPSKRKAQKTEGPAKKKKQEIGVEEESDDSDEDDENVDEEEDDSDEDDGEEMELEDESDEDSDLENENEEKEEKVVTPTTTPEQKGKKKKKNKGAQNQVISASPKGEPKPNKQTNMQGKGTEQEKKKGNQQQAGNEKPSNEGASKVVLEGGVSIKDLKVGNGAICKPGRMVTVYYTGKLKNNKVFDSTTQGAGFKFRVGRGEVIKGWDVGISGMKVGGKRIITCPPSMAYGAKGAPPTIPPNSTLIFEVELRNVN